MKSKIFLLFVFLFAVVGMQAQTAQKVMEQTAAQLQRNGGIKANFEATQFNGNVEQGTTIGTIYIKGDRFKMESNQALIWFDGKTQWSFYANSGEVNLTEPTPEELRLLNPYSFLHLSKQGYRTEMQSVSYQGKSCHDIRLIATRANSQLQEMRLVIDKNSYLPYSIRMKQDGNWFRIRISQVQVKNKWKDSFFQFHAKDHPGVEIIDLR